MSLFCDLTVTLYHVSALGKYFDVLIFMLYCCYIIVLLDLKCPHMTDI